MYDDAVSVYGVVYGTLMQYHVRCRTMMEVLVMVVTMMADIGYGA